MAYLLFFIQQIDWVLMHSTDGVLSDNKNILFVVGLMILVLIYTCKSMDTLSYVSMLAMTSLCVALLLVIYGAKENIVRPGQDKAIKLWAPEGIIYFFGTAIFAFEGN